MKKQRMTIEELRDLKPSLNNPIELVCDTMALSQRLNTISVIGVDRNLVMAIDSYQGSVILQPEILEQYPSQKPKPRFEEVTLWQHGCVTYLVDMNNNFINTL